MYVQNKGGRREKDREEAAKGRGKGDGKKASRRAEKNSCNWCVCMHACMCVREMLLRDAFKP